MAYFEGIGNEVLFSGVVFAILATFPVIHLIRQFFAQNLEFEATNVNSQGDNPSNMFNYQRRSRRQNEDQNCPVCLEELKYAVETNCSHLFCANCLITCWHERNSLRPIECPLCRQLVTVMFPAFSAAEISLPEVDASERIRIMSEINSFNRRFSGQPRPFMDYIRDLPTLLRHLWNEFFTIGGLVYVFRIRVLLCVFVAVLYLISPLDIIPEGVFGIFGLIDDAFVCFVIMVYISIIYRRFLAARAAHNEM